MIQDKKIREKYLKKNLKVRTSNTSGGTFNSNDAASPCSPTSGASMFDIQTQSNAGKHLEAMNLKDQA